MKKVFLFVVGMIILSGLAFAQWPPDPCQSVTCDPGWDGPISKEVCWTEGVNTRTAKICYCVDRNSSPPIFEIKGANTLNYIVLTQNGFDEFNWWITKLGIEDAFSEQFCGSKEQPCPPGGQQLLVSDNKFQCYQWKKSGSGQTAYYYLDHCNLIMCTWNWIFDCEWDGDAGCCLADANRWPGGIQSECERGCFGGCPNLPDYAGESCPRECPY